MVGGGPDTSEGARARPARGRPNWWVILAVSLGLMALLVATAGSAPPAAHRFGGPARPTARVAPPTSPRHDAGPAAVPSSPTTTTTTTTAPRPAPSGSTDVLSSRLAAGTSAVVGTPPAAAPIVTTTTLPPATTTTDPSPSVPADRTQTMGYLKPPVQPSNEYGFTGTGAMAVSVVWSGDTYLTLDVSCPSGDQSVGGTSAMAASLPDASGNCLATVREPASEAASLTYTISIGPTGG